MLNVEIKIHFEIYHIKLRPLKTAFLSCNNLCYQSYINDCFYHEGHINVGGSIKNTERDTQVVMAVKVYLACERSIPPDISILRSVSYP